MITSTQECSYAFQWRCDAWDFRFLWFVWQSIANNHENFAFGKDTFFKQKGIGIVFTDLAFPCSLWSTWLCDVEFALFFYSKHCRTSFLPNFNCAVFPWNSAARSPLHLCAIALAGHPVPDLRHVWKIGKKVIAIEHFFWKTTHHSLWRNLQNHSQEMYPRLVSALFGIDVDSCSSIITCQEFGSSMNIQIHHWCCENPSLRLIVDAVEDLSCVFPPFFQGSSWHMFPLLQRCSYTTWTGSSLIWWSWELPIQKPALSSWTCWQSFFFTFWRHPKWFNHEKSRSWLRWRTTLRFWFALQDIVRLPIQQLSCGWRWKNSKNI